MSRLSVLLCLGLVGCWPYFTGPNTLCQLAESTDFQPLPAEVLGALEPVALKTEIDLGFPIAFGDGPEVSSVYLTKQGRIMVSPESGTCSYASVTDVPAPNRFDCNGYVDWVALESGGESWSVAKATLDVGGGKRTWFVFGRADTDWLKLATDAEPNRLLDFEPTTEVIAYAQGQERIGGYGYVVLDEASGTIESHIGRLDWTGGRNLLAMQAENAKGTRASCAAAENELSDTAYRWFGEGMSDFGSPYTDPIVDLKAGAAHTCALRLSGELTCWGDDSVGQASPPDGTYAYLGNAHGDHMCALSVDGEVPDAETFETTGGDLICWGDNTDGQLDPPEPGRKWVSIGAGWSFTCGVLDIGAMRCWGLDNEGQVSERSFYTDTVEVDYQRIAVGYDHACGYGPRSGFADGVTRISYDCWGSEESSTYDSGTVPVIAGDRLTCWREQNEFSSDFQDGLDLNCRHNAESTTNTTDEERAAQDWPDWMSDDGYQYSHTDDIDFDYRPTGFDVSRRQVCGFGRTGVLCSPGYTLIPPGTMVTSLAMGPDHACGVLFDGTVECWGTGPGTEVPAELAGGGE